jgi:hypothetical protein
MKFLMASNENWCYLQKKNVYGKCFIFEQVIQVRIITCSNITHIPYNLIFTTKFNDSSILFTIIPWDYLNFSLANEYVWRRHNTNQGYQV